MTQPNQYLELCLLGSHISDYPTISHGKTRIPGVNDGEEFELVHVSHERKRWPLRKGIAVPALCDCILSN